MPDAPLTDKLKVLQSEARDAGADRFSANAAIDPNNAAWVAAAAASKDRVAGKRFLLLTLDRTTGALGVVSSQQVVEGAERTMPKAFALKGAAAAYVKLHANENTRFLTVQVVTDHPFEGAMDLSARPNAAEIDAFLISMEYRRRDGGELDRIFDSGFACVNAFAFDGLTWAEIGAALDLI